MRWRSANNRKLRPQREQAQLNRHWRLLHGRLRGLRVPIPTVVDGVITKGPLCPYCGDEMVQTEGPVKIPNEWTQIKFTCHGSHSRPVHWGANART